MCGEICAYQRPPRAKSVSMVIPRLTDLLVQIYRRDNHQLRKKVRLFAGR